MISSNLFALTLSDVVLPEIISSYLNSSRGQKDLQALSSGSSIRGLNARSLLEIPVPIPPLSKQKSIIEYLSLTRNYNDLLRKEMELRNILANAIITQIRGR